MPDILFIVINMKKKNNANECISGISVVYRLHANFAG